MNLRLCNDYFQSKPKEFYKMVYLSFATDEKKLQMEMETTLYNKRSFFNKIFDFFF